mgnify:CR=1 FL=1|jgi:hypothetical protein
MLAWFVGDVAFLDQRYARGGNEYSEQGIDGLSSQSRRPLKSPNIKSILS